MQKYRSAKAKKHIWPLILLIVLVSCAASGYLILRKNKADQNSPSDSNQSQVTGFNKNQYSLTDPGSLWVIVNKNHPLPDTYVPPDLVNVNVAKYGNKSTEEMVLRKNAALALEQMVSAAKTEGVNLAEGSGYRSYALQKFYYDNYVAQSGQAEADKFSAQPGKSEHQTGMAADLAAVDGKCYLAVCFADTPEGKWIAANAYKYGFIVRYLPGKEYITGYQYEPWHVRYIGTDLAKQIQDSSKTMEEYFNYN